MATSRAELEAALKSGHTVRVRGDLNTVRRVKDLPPELAPTEANQSPPKVEGVIVRTPGGHLTREGMELAIREGGSVLFPPFGDEPISTLDDLPTAEEVESWHNTAHQDVTRRIDDQITLLMAQKHQLAAQGPRQQQPQSEQSSPSEQERAEFEAWKRDQRQQQQQPLPQPEEPPAEDVPEAQPLEEEEMGFRKRRK